MDQALLRLCRFSDAPATLADTGPRVELSTLLVLEAVARCGAPASVRGIAEQLDVAHSTASRLVALTQSWTSEEQATFARLLDRFAAAT